MFKTTDGDIIDVEMLSWDEARLIPNIIDPELMKIIDEISPGKDYRLYKAKYPFGAKILDKSLSYLPLQNGNNISFNSDRLPKIMIKDLAYDPAKTNPVAIVLDKNSEFYVSIGKNILPYAMVSPGDIFGTARILDNVDSEYSTVLNSSFSRWELTSGARSIFMLPKITENISHMKLKKMYGLSQDKPDTYQDHWSIFREIAAKTQDNWRSEFLFFSVKWFEKLKDPVWAKLYCYLLRENRRSYKFGHNIVSWEITFNAIEQNKKMIYSPYTLNTARHLFAISSGTFPGFAPTTNEDSAPTKLLQKAYLEGYGLKDQYPLIVKPTHFSLIKQEPVYYFLNYPTLTQCNPQTFKGKSLITLLDELERVIKKYQIGIQEDPLAKHTSLYNIAQATDFSYYHNTPDNFTNINNNILIPEDDQRFVCETGAFPNHSPFLKGCIKVSSR